MLLGLAVLLLCCAVWLDLPGPAARGTVLVDEYHSTWERTDTPYTVDLYGEGADYNYAVAYDYCSRYFTMGRLNAPLDEGALSGCSVLVAKVPTKAYAAAEVEAVRRFVARGGGLLLIGEHTDYMGSGRNLNTLARPYGIAFRYDCLFGIDTTFEQAMPRGVAPHPLVQYLPRFDFAVSASLAPRTVLGRAVFLGRGLKNLPADYYASNYYPPAENRPDMRYGSWVQLWTRGYGRGRVVAFADSTVFSNFSICEPGKSELLLGMLSWAGRRSLVDLRWPLALAAFLLLLVLWRQQAWRRGWPGLAGGAALGFAAAVLLVRGVHALALPLPPQVRPLTRLAVDRTLSAVELSRSGFVMPGENGYAIFERWLLKLGYFTRRTEGAASFREGGCVILCPDRAPTPAYLRQLTRYVQAGGRLLVLDAVEREGSTVNQVLAPFGLVMKREPLGAGELQVPAGWLPVPVDTAGEVVGGRPCLRLNGTPVAAVQPFGRGQVLLIACGSRFNDTNMGGTTQDPPDPPLRQVFELEFDLVRSLMEGNTPVL